MYCFFLEKEKMIVYNKKGRIIMKQKIDLHNHTFGSDGKQTILKLMKRAKSKNIPIVAVTDHDSVEGFHYFQHEICKAS